MGFCCACGKEITLKGEGLLLCPHCNQVPYVCRICQKKVESNEKNTCPFCYWYICECGACAPNCEGVELATKFNIPINIVREIGNIVKGKNILRLCPRNVPISYAKGRFNQFVRRIETTKDIKDRSAWEERLKVIEKKEIGDTWLINKIRKDGEYGQECRDASNWCACLGLCSITHKRKENGQSYFIFERINGTPCQYCHPEQEYKVVCPKCKQQFSQGEIECPNCVYKKGKNKGQHPKLKQQQSRVNLCQLPRSNFQLRKEVI